MDETRYIRGRKVVFERKDPVENLPFTLDVFDASDNFLEVLGRLADLSVAQAAYEAVVKKYPDKRICLRQVCRVIAVWGYVGRRPSHVFQRNILLWSQVGA